MNKDNKRKNAPKPNDRYLNATERRAMRKWEKLKEQYKEGKKQ